MAEKLALTLLGNPELHLAGQPLARFRSVKAYALLYYLAVTKRAQSRTVLAGLFWGDVGDYYARRNLNRTLSNLTQLVGDHLLVERQSLAFAYNQPYSLDVEELENVATTLPTTQTIATLTAAANRYRGDFLDGFSVQEAPEFEQWVLNERTRLRASALHLLHALADYYAEQGALSQAMDYARRILQVEPWREEAHRQLMLLLAQNDQRSAALAQYELCRQVLQSELNVEPAAATLELVERIRAGNLDKVTLLHPVTSSPPHPLILPSPHPVIPSPPHNLPSQRTSFIGRAVELADITRLLIEEEDCRLLTLIGPGGMGKTRLALKAAEQIISATALQERFSAGIFFVPLENVGESNGLASAMISAIAEESSFPLHVDAPLLEQLIHFLGAKSMLFVLDNFEHLVKEAAFLSDLLVTAPQLKLLVTSREPLGLQEAWFYPVMGLTIPNGLPQTAAQQDDYDAVRLFVQCARRTRPSFIIGPERAAVLEICTLVEGMPLGIELAAAWLKVMTCTQIAQEVRRGLDFLTARYQNLPPRHRSMRAVMEHSWVLLSSEERVIVARLSVFRGAFPQEAATAIAGASLYTLAILVEKALLRLRPDGYYQMHELTRQYAAEQIPQVYELHNAHAQYYAGFVQQLGEQLYGATSKAALGQLNLSADNVTGAWQWLLESVEQRNSHPLAANWLAQLTPTLAEWYYMQARFQEGLQRFLEAVHVLSRVGWNPATSPQKAEVSPTATTFAQLRVRIGMLSYDLGQVEAALYHIEAVLPYLQAWGNAEELSLALRMLGKANYRRGQRDEARRQLQDSLHYAQLAHNLLGQAAAFNNLSHLAEDDGDYTACQQLLCQCLAIYEKMNYPFGIGTTLGNLGYVHILQGNHKQALPYLQRSLTLAEQEGDPVSKLINLNYIADAERAQGHQHRAVAEYQRSLALAQQIGYLRGVILNLNGLGQTYLDLADPLSAIRCLTEALSIARKTASITDALVTIRLFAQLWRRQDQLKQALHALAFVTQHTAATAWVKQSAQRLFDDLAKTVTPAVIIEVKHWATTHTLEDVILWVETLTGSDGKVKVL